MQRLPLKSISFLLAAVIVYASQVIPITGVFRLLPESEEIVELKLNGALTAQFKILHTTRLSPIPLFAAGCALDSGAPAWRCFSQFMRVPVTLDGYGTYWTEAEKDRPESVMLGLHRYADDELNNYQGYPESEPFAR